MGKVDELFGWEYRKSERAFQHVHTSLSMYPKWMVDADAKTDPVEATKFQRANAKQD